MSSLLSSVRKGSNKKLWRKGSRSSNSTADAESSGGTPRDEDEEGCCTAAGEGGEEEEEEEDEEEDVEADVEADESWGKNQPVTHRHRSSITEEVVLSDPGSLRALFKDISISLDQAGSDDENEEFIRNLEQAESDDEDEEFIIHCGNNRGAEAAAEAAAGAAGEAAGGVVPAGPAPAEEPPGAAEAELEEALEAVALGEPVAASASVAAAAAAAAAAATAVVATVAAAPQGREGHDVTDSGSDVSDLENAMEDRGSLLIRASMGESLRGRRISNYTLRETGEALNLDLRLNDFDDVAYLAQGAMCAVYSCCLKGRPVVFKTPLPESNNLDMASNDLEVEMLMLQQLRHENIVAIRGAGILSDMRRFIALDFVSFGTLSDLLRGPKSVQLEMAQVLKLALQVCNALQYLHDFAVPGCMLLHRDLKPDNIGITLEGTVKLLDFGLGKLISRKYRTKTASYVLTGGTGSLRYMAPEVALHKVYNEKVDVYSFSLVFWDMLTGVKPFSKLTREQFYSQVVDRGLRPRVQSKWPGEVKKVLTRCWDTNPAVRFSIRETRAILQVAAEEENKRVFDLGCQKRASLDLSNHEEYTPKYRISSLKKDRGGGHKAGKAKEGTKEGAKREREAKKKKALKRGAKEGSARDLRSLDRMPA